MRWTSPKFCIHCSAPIIWKQKYLHKWIPYTDDGKEHKCTVKVKIYTKEEIAEFEKQRKAK